MSTPRRMEISISAETLATALAILQDLINGVARGVRHPTPREQISACKTLAVFKKLELAQQAMDLRRLRQEGKASEVSLPDLVAEAETRAEERRHERDQPARPPRAARRRKR
jgi:hypothetical protein